MKQIKRCTWCEKTDLEREYHDKEWGTPLYDDQKLFEFLILEGAQAGLSWSTILNKRENYRKAFDDFNPLLVAKYTQEKLDELLLNKGIIRNKLKINAAVSNAKAFLKVQEEFGSFASYIWQFTDGKPILNQFKTEEEIPAKTAISEKMSKDLKKRGFKFIGPTICYAFMQATGMVNDHVVSCFRYREVQFVGN